MKATVTRSTARVGQPRLVVEATPEKVTLQFKCGKCKRVLRIDPGQRLSVCVCRNTVANADLLGMAERTLEELEGVVCAVGGDDYFDVPQAVDALDDLEGPEGDPDEAGVPEDPAAGEGSKDDPEDEGDEGGDPGGAEDES